MTDVTAHRDEVIRALQQLWLGIGGDSGTVLREVRINADATVVEAVTARYRLRDGQDLPGLFGQRFVLPADEQDAAWLYLGWELVEPCDWSCGQLIDGITWVGEGTHPGFHRLDPADRVEIVNPERKPPPWWMSWDGSDGASPTPSGGEGIYVFSYEPIDFQIDADAVREANETGRPLSDIQQERQFPES